MVHELSDIKKVRTMLGMSQHDLAIQSGVSQSLIAKTEAGLVDPTYTKAKNIFDTLARLQQDEQQKAQDIMNTSIVLVSPHDTVKTAISLLKEHGISQLPVMSNGKVIGLVTEKSIVEKIAEPHIQDESVQRVMDECPPIVSPKTNKSVLVTLLKEYSFLIVSDKGQIQGIISRTDLLR